MADAEQLAILNQGVEVWNQWREKNPSTKIVLTEAELEGADLLGANLEGANLARADLRGADLTEAFLQGVNLHAAYLSEADLTGAYLFQAGLTKADLFSATLHRADLGEALLCEADLREAFLPEAYLFRADLTKANLGEASLFAANLRGANLEGAHLERADLVDADLSAANLHGTNLRGADLDRANLTDTNLREANLTYANLGSTTLLRTDLTRANLTNCRVYGISAWDVNLADTIQQDLIITPDDQPAITVDNLEVAQFVYLLLHNEKIRSVIDTITSKAVLILGRFTPERKAILDGLRDALREWDYVPILFDFDKPTNEDFTGTIKTLASMCHFVIADITNPKSSPLELQATVPDYMIPFVPIIQEDETPFAMFVDLWIRHRDWVLEPLTYVAANDLIASLEDDIIKPAEERFALLTLRKAQALQTRKTRHRSKS
ncbi:MAG: pentapeptide repeat-containing protein [Caldilineaceae bacterium]|nr:pentapeptide repeat-containing protein [Caldilineaceae bacterium]MCB0184526.1 pentapeptide repeat-containing protein [Caldilineaceae bacterium]